MRQSTAAGLVFVIVMVAASATHAQTVSFYSPYEHPANGAPRSIVAADFDRDGWPDLALGGTTRDSVLVLFNHGVEDGDEGQHFRTPQEVVIGGGPFELAAADLNRDGWPDIAVANADLNAVTVLLNSANGIFRTKIDVAVAGSPRGLAIADFDRDGRLDIFVTKYLGTSVDVLLGAGNGTFPSRRSYTGPANTQGVAAADLNNDGWTDAVTASATGAVTIYYTNATGAVRQNLPIASMASAPWSVVTTGDFDRNGRLDVALASTSSSVALIMYRLTSGTWQPSGHVPVAASPRGIEAADLNQDGRLELALAGRSSSTVSIVFRREDGAHINTEFAAGRGARDVAIADFNRDGRSDVVTANEYGNSTTLLSNNTSLITPAFAFEPVTIPLQNTNAAYAIADFNHNGKIDIVRAQTVLLDGATPSRRLGTERQISNGGAAADFNRDGHMDVVYSFENNLHVFLGDGAGGFVDGPVTHVSWFAILLRAADMNRDGRMDVVATVTRNDGVNSAIEVWAGQGDGRFLRLYHADTYGGAGLQVADVNRNGTEDIVVSSRNGVVVFLCDGTGVAIDAKWFGEGTPRFGLALGYVNWDGILDLVVADGEFNQHGPRWTSRVTVALGNGDGTFQEFGTHDLSDPDAPWETFRTVTLGDLDHDSYPDILAGNGVVLFGGGDGSFRELQRFGVYGFDEALIGDVTGDGLNDAVGVAIVVGGSDYPPIIMQNTRRTHAQNRAPLDVTLPERGERAYAAFFDFDDQWDISVREAYDPDLHALRFRWTTADGRVFSTAEWAYPHLGTGTHQLTVTADDYRGGSASDTMEFVITPHKETVLWPQFAPAFGAWQKIEDATAAGGQRLFHPNANAPKLNAPLASPTNYIDVAFLADKTQVYKLWIRLKAENNNWGNDSVWVQFTGVKDAAGKPLYAIGTTSGLAVNLEECSGCGIAGWGWEDDGWGAVNRNGVLLHFPEGGRQRLRIQTREDGVSIDQIVLSSEKYKTTRPGSAKNDTTKLDPEGPPLEWW